MSPAPTVAMLSPLSSCGVTPTNEYRNITDNRSPPAGTNLPCKEQSLVCRCLNHPGPAHLSSIVPQRHRSPGWEFPQAKFEFPSRCVSPCGNGCPVHHSGRCLKTGRSSVSLSSLFQVLLFRYWCSGARTCATAGQQSTGHTRAFHRWFQFCFVTKSWAFVYPFRG